MSDFVDIVFDGPPSHESGRFVEVEDSAGASIRLGEWVERPDGYWALRIPDPHPGRRSTSVDEPAPLHSLAAHVTLGSLGQNAPGCPACKDAGSETAEVSRQQLVEELLWMLIEHRCCGQPHLEARLKAEAEQNGWTTGEYGR